jgi:hypothetical protein
MVKEANTNTTNSQHALIYKWNETLKYQIEPPTVSGTRVEAADASS